MNSEKERHYLRGEEDLSIVLVHGTMGKSEDCSQVVEELSDSRSVIRPNYIERATETNSTNELAIRNLADEVVAAVRAEGKQRFDLVGGSLGAAVATCIAAEYPEMVRSLVLVSGFSHGEDPRMNLQFKLWLRLASTDKMAFTKLLLVSGLSPGFLSAFDEPTLNGITENFIASTDWRPIDQTIRVDPPAYSENLVTDAKTLELNSCHLIFLEKPVELASYFLSANSKQVSSLAIRTLQ